MIEYEKSGKKKQIISITRVIFFIWFTIIAISISWNWHAINNNTKDIAKAEARANFNKDLAIRLWATKHGGIYVPMNKRTPPNPNLSHIKNRNIITPDGDTLTLMNPAYIIRQMFDEFPKEYGVVGRIVSLKPFNKNNAPDEWETKALLSFEEGSKEKFEFTEKDGVEYLRLMQPLFTKKGCLKCHALQGYKVGDVRGGVGVYLPMSSLWQSANEQRKEMVLLYTMILVLGFIGINYGSRRITKITNEQELTSSIYRTSHTVLLLWEYVEGEAVKFVSENIERLTGYTKNDFLNGKIIYRNIVHSDDLERVDAEIKECNLDFEEYEHTPYRIITKSGEVKWVDDRKHIKRNIDEKITYSHGSITDITKRVKAESKLKESEELYRSVFKYAPLGILHFNLDGVITDCNEEFAKIIGTSREELIGLRMLENLKDKKLVSEIKKTIKTGTGFYDDDYTTVTSKKTIHIILRFKAIYDSENRIISAVGLVEDITERKITEDRLKRSKIKYQDLFEKSSDAILIIKDGKFVDCNDATVKMLRYQNKNELLQTHPSELSPEKQPDGRLSVEKADEMIRLVFEKGSHSFEWDHVRADGKIFPVEVVLTAITNEDGSRIIHTVWRDITERKRNEKIQKALYDIAEEANKASTIREYYTLLHKIIGTLMPAKNFYIAIHNTDKDKITFPYHVDEYDAWPEPKPFGRGLTEYVLKTKKSQIITEARDRELQKNKEVELNGEYTKIWVGIHLEFEGNHKGVLVLQDYEDENAYSDEDVKVLHFVSEQIVKVLNKEFADIRLKNSFKELSEAKKELELINKNKDRFFSIISHDLRSPFMALMGISQMISEDMDSMSVGEVKEMTSAIYHSTQNLNKLIENLLNWSRLQMNTFEVSPKEISLKEVSENVVNLLQLSAKEKNIAIQNNIDETYVFADENCIKTILRNLVNNAIKFTNRGGKVELSSKDKVSEVEIRVADNGVGIKKSIQEKLFSITEKISEVGTEKETGTGLGLILCKELVEKNGGKIWLKSRFGKGSKFTFTLPTKVGNNNE